MRHPGRIINDKCHCFIEIISAVSKDATGNKISGKTSFLFENAYRRKPENAVGDYILFIGLAEQTASAEEGVPQRRGFHQLPPRS
jgi:hypothetical protein